MARIPAHPAKPRRGTSLPELIIVMALILTLAAIMLSGAVLLVKAVHNLGHH